MQNNFKKTPLILSLIFFTLLLLAFLFLHKKINSNDAKAEESTVEFNNEINRRNEIELLNQSIEAIKKDRALLESHFAKSSDIVPFLDELEFLAPRAGVEASVSSVDILKDNTGLLVGVQALGSFANIYKLLTLLENFPYELEIVSMDIQKEVEPTPTTPPPPAQIQDQPLDPSLTPTVPTETVKKAKWQASFSIKLLSFTE